MFCFHSCPGGCPQLVSGLGGPQRRRIAGCAASFIL